MVTNGELTIEMILGEMTKLALVTTGVTKLLSAEPVSVTTKLDGYVPGVTPVGMPVTVMRAKSEAWVALMV